jgi:uncharacterized protein YecT (DUF1311 family)
MRPRGQRSKPKAWIAGAVAVAALLGAIPAAAQDCSGLRTQADMNDCAMRDYRSADAELNARYKAARAELQRIGSGAAALRDAQRAWVTFRDKACEAEGAQYRGGSIEPMIVAGCLARLTRQRGEDLKALAETN